MDIIDVLFYALFAVVLFCACLRIIELGQKIRQIKNNMRGFDRALLDMESRKADKIKEEQ